MEIELEMSDEDIYIIEESSSEYESGSDSMNGTEDSDRDTEFDVNNSSYNVIIEPVDQAPDLSDVDISPWSKVMEEKNGHFEVDFDTTTSGTKHINSRTNKEICKGSIPLTLERCNCKNNEGIHGHNFQYGLDKKNEVND